MSPSTGVAGVLVKTSTARPAGLKLRSAAGLVLPGPGLGVGAGVITGKIPAAFPAPTTMVLTFRSGIGPGMAGTWVGAKRAARVPGAGRGVGGVVRVGRGPRGGGAAG